MLSVWFCVSSRASGVLPPAGRQSSLQGQSVRRGWSRGGHHLLVSRHLRCRHGYAGVLKTGGWELLALLGSFEHIFFSVFRWWAIRRVWMWWSVQILSSYSWVYPPSLSCWYWGRWFAGRITWCGFGNDTPLSFRSSAGLYLVCGKRG